MPFPTAVADATARPSYYRTSAGLEPLDVIRDWGLGFELGNVVKYILRAGRKGDAVPDLIKARQYAVFARDHLLEQGHLMEFDARRLAVLSPSDVARAFGLGLNLTEALQSVFDVRNEASASRRISNCARCIGLELVERQSSRKVESLP